MLHQFHPEAKKDLYASKYGHTPFRPTRAWLPTQIRLTKPISCDFSFELNYFFVFGTGRIYLAFTGVEKKDNPNFGLDFDLITKIVTDLENIAHILTGQIKKGCDSKRLVDKLKVSFFN